MVGGDVDRHAVGRRRLSLNRNDIENHALTNADVDIMDRRLDEILSLGADHVIYYYYPRDVEDPDRAMEVMARHLRAARG